VVFPNLETISVPPIKAFPSFLLQYWWQLAAARPSKIHSHALWRCWKYVVLHCTVLYCTLLTFWGRRMNEWVIKLVISPCTIHYFPQVGSVPNESCTEHYCTVLYCKEMMNENKALRICRARGPCLLVRISRRCRFCTILYCTASHYSPSTSIVISGLSSFLFTNFLNKIFDETHKRRSWETKS
jgi:hypothetical protein